MSTQPLGAPLFRALDSNGAPLSGGLLYSYLGGTSTPQATYTDQSGTVANANPVVLDSTGTAQVWLSPGVLYKFVLKTSLGVQLWSVDNYPSPATSAANTSAVVNDPGGRLTYSSTQPVPTTDQISQSTLYYLPYKSDQVPLYNGSSWSLYSIGTGLSQALTDTLKSPAAVVNNTNYDVFVWLDGSTVRMSRGPAWTSDTARGTGAGTTQLAQVNGRWVNAQSITNGPSANLGLYVGTIRTNIAALGNDSAALRYCWNNYNRKPRRMRAVDAATSWVYSSSTFRQANGNTANQLDFVVGLAEDDVSAELVASASTAGGATNVFATIGQDSTTTEAATANSSYVQVANGEWAPLRSEYHGTPGIGRHFLTWLEASTGGTTTWNGSPSGSGVSGISGQLLG